MDRDLYDKYCLKCKWCCACVDDDNSDCIEDDLNNCFEPEKGKCLGYTDEECINCGRLRVELFENGDEICEKCKFNQLTEEFEF